MPGTKQPVTTASATRYFKDDEAQGSVDSSVQEEDEEKPVNSNVANILARLQSSGALIKKPKQEYRCYTCDEDFRDWEDLENHLIQHVSLPSVVLDKLPSDDEDVPPSGDENWSDEEEEAPPPPAIKTPQKIDISQILKNTGISLKKAGETDNKSSDLALNKLSGLGFTIKKNNTPIKKEPESDQTSNDVMQKLGKLGGIKLKLKSDGNNTNSFKVINGLKDFNASDEEEEGSGNEDKDEEFDEDQDKSGEHEGSGADNESDGENPQSASNNRKTSESDDSSKSTVKPSPLKNLQGMSVVQNEPVKNQPTKISIKEMQQPRPPGRPAVKQTPKRANLPIAAKEMPQTENPLVKQGIQIQEISNKSPVTPERRESRDTSNIVVKQEVEAVETQSSNVPIFSAQIKSERTSPPPVDSISTPIIARVKTELDASSTLPASAAHLTSPAQSGQPAQPVYSSQSTSTKSNAAIPLLPVTKTEDAGLTIIEINGDSNDEDDDCCVVSATPAPDIKPIIPKTESNAISYPTTPSYSSSQPNFSSSSMLSTRLTAPSTEKQHNFNWNAPDSKPPLDMLEKSTDDIFESLLSSTTKKESLSISDASEYISLDTLGPQHTCDVCNTRFTDISLLDDHRRMTGHSKSLVIPPTSSTLMPYNPTSNILSSLLPVKQLADQVGKLTTMGNSGPGFTHQQNVMINIQAYPGGGGMMMPPQSYGSYGAGQNMPPDFSQAGGNMYGAPGQTMPGQYPGQSYVGGQHSYGQFQPGMPKSGYPGTMPPNQYPPSSSPYSSASPLQGMQQTVYGQAPMGGMNSQMGQMGPPGAPFAPTSSSSGTMKPPSSGIKIQNVQNFPVGQTIGQMLPPGQNASGSEMGGSGGSTGQVQMPSPNQIRMAPGANITGTRPRMANPRGPRPSIRPGIQVQGQVRGQKPPMRMPMKRPAGMTGGPGQKRRPDMLLPGKHDNEDCQVMAMQKQREGLPMIHSVQGAKDKLNFGSQISVTKKTVNKEANAMANVLASRGISIKQKQKSRSPTPERPVPHIPNLGAGVSIKHTSKTSNFSIPEAKVGGGMLACRICKKMFMNQNSLSVHMAAAHPQSKVPVFKCDECPASYPKSLQLQHHKRVFHNVSGPNRELGLPVVDLSQEDNLKRLSSLGIYSFIPLANREQANGCFGIPVISVQNAQNGLVNSLQALGADGLLSLGPLKPLPNS
ncbi:unnamed protein product [Arctia plantaginis]|uniref:C2H2-type domain-containing protein n=1 Tax=Arctia plantaginis TaxID=874455 RepID=A0A8S1AWH6_ARCPL|nr:unnamed protein product [Arctia plantaginis]CAB3249660.1 unnamed protein product [Arctia plantaginis]